jgi:mono/diheme cytochrome c family protein
MIRHFKIWFLVLVVVLVALVVFFSASLYLGSCSYRDNCRQGGRARLAHTPIPTLIPLALASNAVSFPVEFSTGNCTTNGETLLSAWVSAGFPEKDNFNFVDASNTACVAAFSDTQTLLTQGNLWYPGALACTSCHNSDLSAAASAQLDLSSYAGILAGSHRAAGSAKGDDILGNGAWETSKLYQVLFVQKQMPIGRPADSSLDAGPLLYAGIPAEVANATPTTTPAPEEIARPNTPGGPGDAVNLKGDAAVGAELYKQNCLLCHAEEGKGGVLNPGSDDGTVPELNPLDATLIDPDYKVYAYNVDLFLENGSRPSGPNPARAMPAWGAQKGLTQQQIADLIAYIISLNPPSQ